MSTSITAPLRPPSNINPGVLSLALAVIVVGAWWKSAATASWWLPMCSPITPRAGCMAHGRWSPAASHWCCARLAYGYNIGAYFSGIISGSLHGWLWLVAAFIGNVIGTRLRSLLGLEVEPVKPTAC